MARKKRKGNRLLRIILFPFRLFLVIFLPFFLLIRVSSFLYLHMGWNPYICMGIGAGLTFAVLFYYLGWLYKRLSGKNKVKRIVYHRNLKFAALVVVFFCVYALIYLSAGNAKTETVRSEYTNLHPIVRLAVSSLALVDRDLVVTDMTRTHEDYAGMGLKSLKNSLHYTQSTGYVHAVDLRTAGRAEWRNTLLKFYFVVMGFSTLRHVGTGDHLHISLPIRENPWAL